MTIHLAAAWRRVECIKALLGEGARTTVENPVRILGLSMTTLKLSIFTTKSDMRKFLLSEKADIWSLDSSYYRETVAHFVEDHPLRTEGLEILYL